MNRIESNKKNPTATIKHAYRLDTGIEADTVKLIEICSNAFETPLLPLV